MKQARVQDAVPQWTKFVPADGGRNPLGLARVAAMLTDYLLPGIVVNTNRARYYSLYTWILWHIRATEAVTTYEAFEKAFQRREAAVAFATALQSEEASINGARVVRKQIEDKAIDEFVTEVRMLPSNSLGGYGQYYAGSLYELRLAQRAEGGVERPGAPIGDASGKIVNVVISPTPWFEGKAFESTRVKRQVLSESAERLSLDGIREPFAAAEREKLIEIFFGFNDNETPAALLRRSSLLRLLDVVSSYEQAGIVVGGDESPELYDSLLFAPCYFGALMNSDGAYAAEFVEDPRLKRNAQFWRQHCLHEFLSWAWELVLEATLVVAGSNFRGVGRDEIALTLVGASFRKTLAAYSTGRRNT